MSLFCSCREYVAYRNPAVPRVVEGYSSMKYLVPYVEPISPGMAGGSNRCSPIRVNDPRASQILRKDNEGSSWYPAPQNALSLRSIRERSMMKRTYLQIKVERMERFSWFACGMVINPCGGKMLVDQKDKRFVRIRNLCDVPLLVVEQPGGKPGAVARAGANDDKSMIEQFKNAAGSARFQFIDRGLSFRTRVSERKGPVRLLIATKEYSNDFRVETFVLKLWSSIDTKNGREVRLFKPLIDGDPQVEDNIIRGEDVKLVILALDNSDDPGAKLWLKDRRRSYQMQRP